MEHNGFQTRCRLWVEKTFGHQTSETRQKGFRFLEEAVELVESLGMTRENCHKIVDYVFDRNSPGEPYQELGGVMVTLATVAQVNGMNMLTAGSDEITRCEANTDKIREKDKRKPDFVKGTKD